MTQPPPLDAAPAQPSTPAAQPQPPPQKSGLGSVVAVLVFSCFGCGAIGFIGSLGLPAVFIGLIGGVGCVVAFVKGGPQHRVKFALGALASFFLIITGLGHRSETAAQAAISRKAAEAQKKHAEESQQKHAAASSQLRQLPASASVEELASLCSQVQGTGGIPEADHARCGDAYFQQGSALLKSGKPGDALALLQRAESLSTQKEAVAAALATARELHAQETFKEKTAEATERLGSAKTLAGRKEWEAAEKELDAASAILKPFEGTAFEKSKEWATLTGQVAQQHKRIQQGLIQSRPSAIA